MKQLKDGISNAEQGISNVEGKISWTWSEPGRPSIDAIGLMSFD
jgi:hypothetical protein